MARSPPLLISAAGAAGLTRRYRPGGHPVGHLGSRMEDRLMRNHSNRPRWSPRLEEIDSRWLRSVLIRANGPQIQVSGDAAADGQGREEDHRRWPHLEIRRDRRDRRPDGRRQRQRRRPDSGAERRGLAVAANRQDDPTPPSGWASERHRASGAAPTPQCVPEVRPGPVIRSPVPPYASLQRERGSPPGPPLPRSGCCHAKGPPSGRSSRD